MIHMGLVKSDIAENYSSQDLQSRVREDTDS